MSEIETLAVRTVSSVVENPEQAAVGVASLLIVVAASAGLKALWRGAKWAFSAQPPSELCQLILKEISDPDKIRCPTFDAVETKRVLVRCKESFRSSLASLYSVCVDREDVSRLLTAREQNLLFRAARDAWHAHENRVEEAKRESVAAALRNRKA